MSQQIVLGVVSDNKDPKRLGRIRFKPFANMPGNIEGAFNYKQWDENDPFVAFPFLPTPINVIPEVDQNVQLLFYDVSKDLINISYVAGPYNTPHDFTAQTFTDGSANTTYNNTGKRTPDVINPDGSFIEKKANGGLAKDEHHGLYGMYGSDIIFTDDGLHIRGGKFPSKDFANPNDRKKLVFHPIMSDNVASLHLKKFPQTLELIDDQSKNQKLEKTKLKYLVEYEIEDFSFTGGTILRFFIFNTSNENDLFYSDNLRLNEVTTTTGSTLVNIFSKFNETPNDKTNSFTVTVKNVKDAWVTIRSIIKGFNNKGFSNFYIEDKDNDVHPFYFRPTKNCVIKNLTGASQTNRDEILDNVYLLGRYTEGIVYKRDKADVPIKSEDKLVKVLKETETKQEQTFSSLKSDKIYLLSTNTDEPKPINFKKIEKYEPTQKNYIEDIDPNTYSLVRGEVLLDILKTMSNLFESHIHQPSEPLIKADPNFIQLQSSIKNLERELLNKSIRIN